MNKRKLIVVVGATGAGKSDVALELAKNFGAFLIAADSRQIYKELDIVTGKDQGEWRDGVYYVDGVPEYMVDFLDPREQYSAAEYQLSVYNLLNKKNNDLPIIVGGTGLYVNAIVDNYDFSDEADYELRNKLEDELQKQGLSHLATRLKNIDPELEIDDKNPRRVLRALEYCLSSGKLWSQASQQKKTSEFDVLMIGINWEREILYERIEQRVDKMMAMGALAEARQLYEKYGENWPAVNSLGYEELIAHIKGEIPLAEAVEKMKQRSRNYAKRQLTWFKRDERIHWFDKTQLKEIQCLVKGFLGKDKS